MKIICILQLRTFFKLECQELTGEFYFEKTIELKKEEWRKRWEEDFVGNNKAWVRLRWESNGHYVGRGEERDKNGGIDSLRANLLTSATIPINNPSPITTLAVPFPVPVAHRVRHFVFRIISIFKKIFFYI